MIVATLNTRFTTSVIRRLKCCKFFTTNVRTIIDSRDAKCENMRVLGPVKVINSSLLYHIRYSVFLQTDLQSNWVLCDTTKQNYLGNKFHFSEVHGSMKATGLVQSKWRPKGVTLTLHGARCILTSMNLRKTEIHFLYLHFIFTSFLFIICGIFI